SDGAARQRNRGGQRRTQRVQGRAGSRPGIGGARAPNAWNPCHASLPKTELNSTIIDGRGVPYKGAGIGLAGGEHTLSSAQGADNGHLSCREFRPAPEITVRSEPSSPRDSALRGSRSAETRSR